METKNKQNNLIFSVLAVLLVIWGILLIFKNNNQPTNNKISETEITPTEVIKEPSPTEDTSITKIVDVINGEISIEAGSFYFKPNIIRVKKGETVKLTLISVSMVHDFNIDELEIKIPLTKSGNSSTVEFTADKVGEYEFYCSVGSHRALGQIGKLIVIE